MSSQQTSITHSALGWVKKSIDENLSEIKIDLRRYIENGDGALLESGKQRLAMIQSVLVMIEQYGAAMLTEEMVALVDYIVANKQEEGDQALEVLLRAVLQLPDYLEHIQSGHRDIPIAILPLLNDIRAVRNQDLFSEKLLFLPDLSMHEQPAENESIDDNSNQASRLLIKKLRPIYQLALLNVIRGKSVEESLQRLEKVCATLEERSVSEQMARIWWIVGALIESVSRQQLELGVSIKSLLGKVDALFRVILIIGERGLLKRQPVELIKNFLYYIAQPQCDGPKTQAIKTAYRLQQFLPSESARSEVLSNIAGPNQALLKTVAEAMKADIETVKSTLEVYVNGDLSKVESLKDLPQEMHIISDTLAMIGLGAQRQLIQAQIEVVKQLVAGESVANEAQLLSMAAELLQVEQALDQMQKRQPVDPEKPRSETDVSRDYELDSVLTAVVAAALGDIQKIKNAILEFVKDPERSGNIDLCITLLTESRGALELLEDQRAVDVVDGLLAYMGDYDSVAFVESTQLDALSQIIASLEYYLEALGERRSDASSILDLADTRLRGLLALVKLKSRGEAGTAPVTATRAETVSASTSASRPETGPVPSPAKVPELPAAAVKEAQEEPATDAPAATSEEHTPAALEDTLVVNPVGAASQTADAPTHVMGVLQDQRAAEASTANRESSSGEAVGAVPVDEELEVLKSGSDPEILEIYLEEAAEEADNIARLQQDWLLHPEDENALKNIRRAFHTIKGSGRLVGASKIGEFAWEFEQLLNRVIDKTVPPSKQVIHVVGGAARALPELVHELKTFEEPSADIASLRGTARALAEFKTEQLLIDHTQTLTAVESPYDHITDNDAPIGVPVDNKETTDIGFGATTQVMPPDNPAQAMTDEIEPDTPSVDPVALGETENREDTPAQESQPAGGDDATNLGKYDNTELTESPPVPSMEERHRVEIEARKRIAAIARARTDASYERAVDYSKSSSAHGEADDVTLSGDAPAIEFADQSEIDSLPSQSSLDVSSDEQSSMTESPDDTDELTPQAAEAESEELMPKPPTVERVEELLIETAREEAEEITMEMPAAEMAEDIVMETPAQEVADFELEFKDIGLDADADEPGSDQAEAESGEMPASAQRRRDPPDPFVVATSSPVPGDGAGARAPGPTGLSFDPELLTIYQQEVEQHLGTVNSALDRAEEIRELVPGEAIYRALHTINGASRTADIGTIGKLAEMLEKPLKSAIAQNMALDHEVVALYREGQRALQQMTAQLVATREMPPIPEDLQISLQALAEDFEEYTVDLTDEETGQSGEFIDTLTMMNEAADSEQDDELLSIFVDEANELLEMSDNTLHQWSQLASEDPGAQGFAAVMELQRYLHTLKGGARMAELKQIGDLSHEMESVFIAVIDGRIDKTANLFELLKDSFDLLHRQVSQAQQGEEMTSAEDMVALLKNLRLGEDEGSIADSSDQSPGLDMDSENIDIVSENLPGGPLSGSDRPAQDVIKVRATLLDNLVNSAGEVSIYRARMEQQVAGLGTHLGELGQTISRLKLQLRSLEAETDAQIHFSHRTESNRSGEFDPLEMDRYTLIQELSRSLGESVNDLSSLQGMLGEQVRDSETLLLQQSRVSTDLQDGLIKSRMVRFSGLLSRLRRLVRQSSQELGKKAELVVKGEQNEVDNKVLDRMVAPLEHIIRNALSHGIETPVERVRKGKPEIGKIEIDITRDGSDVVIRVNDDGAGVDIEKVRSRAIQLGLLEQGREASETELVQLILEPGFSTAEQVTQLSGRGVGMDVVDIEVKQLGGTLQIETTPQGTTFVARLPFTLSINQAILVRCGDETYAIPLLNIEGITRIDAQQMHEHYREEAPEIEYAGQDFALHNLARLVGAETPFRAGEAEKQAIILSRAGDIRVALHVDEIIGNREIVVKTLGKQLSQIKSLAGASILADGSVVLILDVGGLVRQILGNTVKVVYQAKEEVPRKLRDTVMVVDDSITMRRVASKLLERHNYDVITAKDGVDALAQLQDVHPDVILLDIEMPRMDGFELATHMQNEAIYSHIPIIMITSRTGEKHRDRALEIGVTNYMGKPYHEDELIENIQSALGGR